MPLIYLSLAWIAGILLGAKVSPPFAAIFIGLGPLPLLFFIKQRRGLVILASLCMVAFFSGAFYFHLSQPPIDENHVQFYNDSDTLQIRGLVSRDPEIGAKTTHLQLSASEITQGKEWRRVSGEVLLLAPRNSVHHYGDILLATGKLETPPRLGDFDYQGYLAHQGIYSVMSYPGIKTLATGQGFKPLGWIYHLRERLSQTLAEVLPEPQASLAQGIILGLRGNIPSSVNDEFIHTGTAHLLAISGMNLSIIAGILVSLGIALFGRRHYIYVWLALGAVWLYAVLTGLQAPVVRSAIMASLFLTAELLGRQRSAIIALVFAAAVMVGFNPQLLWDASFQLSFMAMAGLIFVFPRLQAPARKAVDATLGDRAIAAQTANFVVDSLGVSLAAVIAVWPLIAHYFGIISWVGPVATFATMFSLPGITVFGALAGILGIFVLPLAQVAAWFAWLFLSYLLLAVKVFNLAPFSQVDLDTRWIWLYYAAIGIVLWLGSVKAKVAELIPKVADSVARLPRKWVVPGLLSVTILVWAAAATLPDEKLHVAFLDVGQGDAILIEKGNQQVLVDGGPTPEAIALGLSKEMPFWDRTIDLVILTHPHADHITGLLEVLKRYHVNQVLYPNLESDSSLYRQWLGLIKERGIKSTVARAGQRITIGEVAIEVLNPSEIPLSGTASDIDNNGVVLRVTSGEVSFLLTADIQREAELELIARRAGLASTVLKVGHHGSETSTSREFLTIIRATVAVISVGTHNDFGHPNKEVLARLTDNMGQANIYRTDEHGKIRFTTDGKKLWVKVDK